MHRKDRRIVEELRNNSRTRLRELSKATKIPISTVHERICNLEQKNIVRFVSLPDYKQLQIPLQVWIFLSTKNREEARNYLREHPHINTLFEINNGADFLMECFFMNFSEYNEFTETINKHGKVITHPVLEEIGKEIASINIIDA